jgi:aryl-alcohol dehydrogenase-like predicted oxidoreductase
MHYRILGRTGLRVSAMALGTGSFGTAWGYGAEREAAETIFRHYRSVGGNFIDTANTYQFGQAETLVGEFIKGDRDDIVLASKFSLPAAPDAGLQATGNSRKAMVQSVEESLRRLCTDRIDLLWVHLPDGVTPTEEIVRGLDNLVRSGKILYAGLSDFPAWRVATAATLAELRGWAPIAAVQIEYSLIERTPERELMPMANAFGLATVAWGALAGGLLTGKYRRGEEGRLTRRGGVGVHAEDDLRKTAVLDALLSIAGETGLDASVVATAWVMAKEVLPIIGARSPEQLETYLRAWDVRLTDEHLARLDAASAIPMGFPHELLASPAMMSKLNGGDANRVVAPDTPPR